MTDDPDLDRQGKPWTKEEEEEGCLKWAYAKGLPLPSGLPGLTLDALATAHT